MNRLREQARRGRLLLFRYHDEHNEPFWSTVGGKLEDGEDYLAAAQRELEEETGITAEIGLVLADREEIYPVARSGPVRWLERYFLVRCNAPQEIDRFRMDRGRAGDDPRLEVVGSRGDASRG